MAASQRLRNRRLLLGSIIAAAVALALLLPIFTLVYATRLSALGLVAGLLLIIVMALIPVGLVYGRIASEKIGQGKAGGLALKPGAPIVGLVISVISIAWLFITQAMDGESFLAASHWLVQIVLVVALVVTLLLVYVQMPGKVRNDLNDIALDNADRRQRVIANLARLQQDGWIAAGTGLSPQGRFRAALGWWEEEITHVMPDRGLALADEQVTFVLEEARRQLSLINDLAQRDQLSDEVVVDAEKRILDSIELASRLTLKGASAPA
jgi:hypothetical protein